MTKRYPLGKSPTGIEHYAEIDHDGNELTLIEFTPGHIGDDILASCAELRGLDQRPGSGVRLVARTPLNTYQAWRRDWQANYADKMTWAQFEVSKLNSRENCQLRTWKGRGVYGRKL